mmetsp:Transcript_4589/g.13011  ORF Transcript_4589/g.13011 Transcript_4589/m.13011 type:complete len:235 (-) Transcript_4589:60-764(-)
MCAVNLIRQNVQQHLRIRPRPKMPVEKAGRRVEHLAQLVRIRQIPVMDQVDPQRAVHEKRLRLRSRRRPSGRVPHVPHAHRTVQRIEQLLVVKHVLHQPVRLVLVEFIAVCRDHPRRVLPAMLKHQQPLVDLHVGTPIVLEHADDPAHPRRRLRLGRTLGKRHRIRVHHTRLERPSTTRDRSHRGGTSHPTSGMCHRGETRPRNGVGPDSRHANADRVVDAMAADRGRHHVSLR